MVDKPAVEDEDVAALIARLRANVAALVDEKHVLTARIVELEAANARLGEAARALIAEKGDLQRRLAAKEGMGVQQNEPGAFKELKDGAGH